MHPLRNLLLFSFVLGQTIGVATPAQAGRRGAEFPIPTPGSAPYGIAAGVDGNLWFTEYSGNKIGRVTTLGVFTEYLIRTSASTPSSIAAGPDGNLWFTEAGGNNIGYVRPTAAAPRSS